MSAHPLARLGGYDIVGTIGRGGMAEVLLARMAGADGFTRDVVIKRILPELAHEREFIDMFRDEARITAQLRHGNIAQVLDFRHDDGQYYLLLEYVDGPSLATLMSDAKARGTHLAHVVVAHVLSEVARALDYAHRKRGPDGASLGVVHRDVSPSNVLVSRDGEVKLTDFGIARASSRVSVTVAGSVKGKIAYMAPEALLGEPTASSDLFALGVMGWEMIVGTLPFAAPTNEARMFRVVTETAQPVTLHVPDVPPALAEIIARLLAREAAERPARAAEVVDALATLVASAGVPVQELLAERIVAVPESAPPAGAVPTRVASGISRSLAQGLRASEATPSAGAVSSVARGASTRRDGSVGAAAEGPGKTPLDDRGAPRLLLVDASPTTRALVRSAVGGALPIVEATDAAQALELAKTMPLALVLAQHLLPNGQTGLTLCRELRAMPEHARVTFALAVFESSPAIEQEGREAGVSVIVSKSDPKALVVAIRRLVTEVRASLSRDV